MRTAVPSHRARASPVFLRNSRLSVTSANPKAKNSTKHPDAAPAAESHLSQTLGTPPVSFGNIVEGWDQAEGVVAVITPVTQEETVLIAATATQEADVQVHLEPQHGHRIQGGERPPQSTILGTN